MPKHSTANSVQQHTEAKLQFYTRYLSRYLAILLRAQGVEQINLYDLFCGEGKYSDGNTGSAVRAVDAVWEALIHNLQNRPINLHLNDLNPKKVDKLRRLLADRESAEKRFSISYTSMEASDLLDRLLKGFAGQAGNVRNLVFIDPYGYKEIDRAQLQNLLMHGRTEVVLFLPIEQMYRFLVKAAEAEAEKFIQATQKFCGKVRARYKCNRERKGFYQGVRNCIEV